MKNFYHVFPGAIPPAKCNEIIRRGLSTSSHEASIGFNNDHVDNSYRIGTIHWFNPIFDKDIGDIILSFAYRANRESFGFEIFPYANDLQFTEYKSNNGGKYDWHHDVWWDNPAPHDRKLSIVVQLSPPESYQGGQFELREPGANLSNLANFTPQGSVIVFPSFFTHRVTPITYGTRYSLVSWIEGPKFK